MKRVVSLISKTILGVGLWLMPAALFAAEPVSYLDWDDEKKEMVEKTCTEYEVITQNYEGEEFYFSDDNKWYVINSVVTCKFMAVLADSVHFIICDGASLTVNGRGNLPFAGIEVNENHALTIYGQKEGTGRIVAKGGECSAGIGGSAYHQCGTITINGGVVESTGGEDEQYSNFVRGGSGIGSGGICEGSSSPGKITINGGMVTAKGIDGGAGIGGGGSGDGATVIINGGTVATVGENGGAGIGGGFGGKGGEVTINGGVVMAIGGIMDSPSYFDDYGGAGIGGGRYRSGGIITINDGEVAVFGGSHAAGIGGGFAGSGQKVFINGGRIMISSGGADSSVIGKGGGDRDELDDGVVLITGGVFGMPIESGWVLEGCGVVPNKDEATKEIYPYTIAASWKIDLESIKNLTVGWTSGDGTTTNQVTKSLFAIPKEATNVKIVFEALAGCILQGSSVIELGTLTSDLNLAHKVPKAVLPYLDWDYENNELVSAVCEDFEVMTEETETLKDGKWYVVNSHIVRSGAIVVEKSANLILGDDASLKVTGSREKPGVEVLSDRTLVIFGQQAGTGKLTATGASEAAGIGGGFYQSGGSVIINGGTVIAQGGDYGAGIGGGNSGSGCQIVYIHGGTITATGGRSGAGIGGGEYGKGGVVEIIDGIVTCLGGWEAAPIGGGKYGDGVYTDIKGGKIKLVSDGCTLIGRGPYGTSDGTIKISKGLFNVNMNMSLDWLAPKARYLRNDDPLTAELYPVAVDRVYEVTIGSHRNIDVSWIVEGMSEPKQVQDSDFFIPIEAKNLRIFFEPFKGFSLDGVNLINLGNITEDMDIQYRVPESYISYLEWDDEKRVMKETMQRGRNCEIVTENTSILEGGKWYVVNSTISRANIKVSNLACLILCDDSSLSVSSPSSSGMAALSVPYGNTLKIYGQTKGNGQLTAATATNGSGAGIGGDDGQSAGTIVINGGQITASSGVGGAGIGGGNYGSGGEIIIFGGVVRASCFSWASGIGGGKNGSAGYVYIGGGTVIASEGVNGVGIGSGSNGRGGNIIITGGKIANTSIGAGASGTLANISISGGVFGMMPQDSWLNKGYVVLANVDTATARDYPHAVVKGILVTKLDPDDRTNPTGMTLEDAVDYVHKNPEGRYISFSKDICGDSAEITCYVQDPMKISEPSIIIAAPEGKKVLLKPIEKEFFEPAHCFIITEKGGLQLSNLKISGFVGSYYGVPGDQQTSGGAIWCAGKLKVNNCEFKNCLAGPTKDWAGYTPTGCGGAVAAVGKDAEVEINDSVFENCHAANGGALASLNGAAMMASRVKFKGNMAHFTLPVGKEAQGYGAATYRDKDSSLIVFNCEFDGNKSFNNDKEVSDRIEILSDSFAANGIEWYSAEQASPSAPIKMALNSAATPAIAANSAPNFAEETVTLVIDNVKPGLKYALGYTDTLAGEFAAESWTLATSEGQLEVSAPKGEGASRFFRVLVSDQ